MSEKEFQQRIIARAKYSGFEFVYFTWRSDHSPAGFPDLILLKDKTMIVMEIKDTGKQPSPEQYFWLVAFSKVTKHTYLIHPEDEETLVAKLFDSFRGL